VSFEEAKRIALARSWGRCEGCGVDKGMGLDPHHRMTRGMGGVHRAAAEVSNDPRNLLMLCRPCHDLTLSASTVARCIADGWVIERRAGVDPREVPAKIHTVNGRGWWRLLADGGYEWADTENLDPFYALTYAHQHSWQDGRCVALSGGPECADPDNFDTLDGCRS